MYDDVLLRRLFMDAGINESVVTGDSEVPLDGQYGKGSRGRTAHTSPALPDVGGLRVRRAQASCRRAEGPRPQDLTLQRARQCHLPSRQEQRHHLCQRRSPQGRRRLWARLSSPLSFDALRRVH